MKKSTIHYIKIADKFFIHSMDFCCPGMIENILDGKLKIPTRPTKNPVEFTPNIFLQEPPGGDFVKTGHCYKCGGEITFELIDG